MSRDEGESGLEPVPELEDSHEGGTVMSSMTPSKNDKKKESEHKLNREETMVRLTKSQSGPFFQAVMNTPDQNLKSQ